MSIWHSWSNGGLGDYIHLHAENYRKYGINRNFGSSSSFNSSAIQAYQDAKAIASKTQIKGANTKVIADFYTQLFRTNDVGASKALGLDEVADFGKMESALAQAVAAKLPAMGKMFDRQGLTVTGSANFAGVTYSGLKDKDRMSIRRTTLENMIPKVNQCIEELGKEFQRAQMKGTSEKNLNAIQNNINTLKTISDYLENYVKEMQANGEYLKPFRYSKDQYNFLGEMLQELSYITKAYSVPTKEEIGTVAEYTVAAGAAVAGGMASKITANLLDSFVVGGKESGSNSFIQVSPFIDKSAVLKELNANVVGGKDAEWTIGADGSTLVSGHTSQDTVDVDITFNDSNNIFNTDHLQASVKNYFDPKSINTNHPGVSVISGVPFTSILGLVNSDFSNHYLNYLVGHGGNGDFAENVLKYIVAVRGLTGARSAQFNKLSQYFIVFSRIDRKAYVFTTTDLLNKISPGPGLIDERYVDVNGIPTAGALAAANARVDSFDTIDANVQSRIAKVLTAAHSFKISMSLLPATFG